MADLAKIEICTFPDIIEIHMKIVKIHKNLLKLITLLRTMLIPMTQMLNLAKIENYTFLDEYITNKIWIKIGKIQLNSFEN